MTEEHPLLHEEAPGVWRVDLRWRGMPAQIAAYLVADGGALAVVESGPGSTLPTLREAIRALGRDPAEVTHVLVTHVHLDHAGGAGALLRDAPGATLYAHPVGAPHLADPSRLMRSAGRIYGDRMETWWGEMLPVDPARMVELADGAEVRVGERTLRALDTPGHAWHHHAYHDPDAGLVFTGDVGGIRLERAAYVCAPTPPPDVDVEAWEHSVSRLRAVEPTLLLPTHFGGVRDVGWHLDDLAARLASLRDWGLAQVAAGADTDALTRALREREGAAILRATGSEAAMREYEWAVPYEMMAAGLMRYLERRGERGLRAAAGPAGRPGNG
ncbi:MAG TPA: MBL fold metallo-hydrolase [Longimicrobium sp.]|nr:MBL fold metallo-hydrolase [Longimicrobium sp.]